MDGHHDGSEGLVRAIAAICIVMMAGAFVGTHLKDRDNGFSNYVVIA